MRYLIAAVFLFIGCTIHRPLAISSAVPQNVEVIGPVTGRTGQSYLLGIPLSVNVDYSLKTAQENALDGTKGHAVINSFVDEKCFYFLPFLPIYVRCDLMLTGTAIRYKNIPRSKRLYVNPSRVLSRKKFVAISGESLYKDMLNISQEEAEEKMGELHFRNFENLKYFITHTKGEASLFGWTLRLKPNLPEREREFIGWFIPKYTLYKISNDK